MPEPSLQALFFRDFQNSYIPQILEEIYIKQVYKPFLLGRKDLTIVDIGANLGLTAYYFKDFAKKVYAVEPSQQHLDVLNEMLRFNKITNVTVCPYAISNEDGKTKFYHNQNVTMFSMESVVNDKNDFEEVQMVTMDRFMKEYEIDHIDLLKLDPEGSEGKIIASEGFQKVAPKIKVVVGEWHQWGSMSKDLFMNTFRDLGYEFKWNIGTDASVYSAVRI